MAIITGLEDVLKKLHAIGRRTTRNKIARRAVTKGAQIVYKAARQDMIHEDRTKALRKSYGYKVKTKDDVALAIIGSKSSVRTTWTSPSGRVYPVRPIFYDHLVEFGHQAQASASGQGGARMAKAYPHQKPAWQRTKSEVREAIAESLRDGLMKEAAK